MRVHSPAEACYGDEWKKVNGGPSKDQELYKEERGSPGKFMCGNRCI